jgi:hypothetical protein
MQRRCFAIVVVQFCFGRKFPVANAAFRPVGSTLTKRVTWLWIGWRFPEKEIVHRKIRNFWHWFVYIWQQKCKFWIEHWLFPPQEFLWQFCSVGSVQRIRVIESRATKHVFCQGSFLHYLRLRLLSLSVVPQHAVEFRVELKLLTLIRDDLTMDFIETLLNV